MSRACVLVVMADTILELARKRPREITSIALRISHPPKMGPHHVIIFGAYSMVSGRTVISF